VLAFLAACKPAEIAYVKYDNEEGVPRISAADAKKDLDAGNAVLVDSRDAGAFNFERLPGAINIMAGASPDKFNQLPKGKKIIVYCT
jgi:rhodanese-related sulfurtransferase